MQSEREVRIMVVEDEVVIAMNLQSMLEEMGYQVPAVAATGEEAIARAWEHDPDLALMDIRLRGQMSGIETAAHLRDQLGLSVVFLTAHSDEETRRQAKAVWPLGYLLKPVQKRMLYVTVEVALGQIENVRQREEMALPLDISAALAQAERQVILRALERTGNDAAAAARLLGVDRSRVYRVMTGS